MTSTMNKTLLLPAATILLTGATAAHGALVIEQPNAEGNFGNAATGQSFTPSIGITATAPDPVPPVTTTAIDLVSFSFVTNGGSTGAEFSYLQIYDTNPSGSITAANLIGSSTNALDTRSSMLTDGQTLTWNFNNPTLDYNTLYFAVFSDSQNDVIDINNIGIGLKVSSGTSGSNPYPGGTGLVNNFGGGSDTTFTAVFTNPVPEPGSLALITLGGTLIMRRRRD